MFLLKRPLCAYDLYKISRRLAAFGAQDVLKSLPLRFLTRRKARGIAPDLSEAPERRLCSFLEHSKTAERALAFYLSLYPDVTGKELSDITGESIRLTLSVPNGETPESRKEAFCLLKLFYALCLDAKTAVPSSEHFEKWLGELSDFRLEAAALERLNDAFYEDDFVSFARPDWSKTSKDELVAETKQSLVSVKETPDHKKTAEKLVKTVTAMLLRDGFAIVPSSASCLCDKAGDLFFIRADRFSSFGMKEHQIIRSTAGALLSGSPASALKALNTAGYLPISDTNALSGSFNEGMSAEAIAGSIDRFFDILTADGSTVPFFLRYAISVLKETGLLCASVLQTPPPWNTVQDDVASFLSVRKRNHAEPTETAKDFKKVFSFERHQVELSELRGKKLPVFLEDTQKIPEILSRQTISYLFKKGRFHIRPVLLPLTLFLIIVWLCSYIK